MTDREQHWMGAQERRPLRLASLESLFWAPLWMLPNFVAKALAVVCYAAICGWKNGARRHR